MDHRPKSTSQSYETRRRKYGRTPGLPEVGGWPAGSWVVAAMDEYTRTTDVLWGKRDGRAALYVREGERARESPRERADPCLDRLLLPFWAHDIEGGPHLLGTGSL